MSEELNDDPKDFLLPIKGTTIPIDNIRGYEKVAGLYQYDGLDLLSIKIKDNNLVLHLVIDMTEDLIIRHAFIPVSSDILVSYIEGKITCRDVMEKAGDFFIFDDGEAEYETNVKKVSFKDLPEDDLPTKDSFLFFKSELDNEDIKECQNSLLNKIEKATRI